jgi:hypothetical protein
MALWPGKGSAWLFTANPTGVILTAAVEKYTTEAAAILHQSGLLIGG